MPNKDISESGTIYHHLSEIQRLHNERERLDRQIGDLSQKRREVNIGYHHHVAAVEPYFERLPGDVIIDLYSTAMWLDPKEGLCVCKLRPWTDLVPDVEPEPIRPAAPPVIVPAPDARPMSYGERQATQRYVPEPLIDTDRRIDDVRTRLQAEAAMMIKPLTDAQIDEGAEYEAEKDEPGMSDDEIDDLEQAAMAYDPDDTGTHAAGTLDGHTFIGNNGEAR